MKPLLTFISTILTLTGFGCWGGLPGDSVIFGGQVLLQDGSPLGGVEVAFFMPDPPNVNSKRKAPVPIKTNVCRLMFDVEDLLKVRRGRDG